MNRLFNLFMALAFIGFGIILVLGNLGIGEIGSNSIWSYAFPLFFLGMGLTMIIGYIMKYAEGWMLGSFFFILGLLLFLGQLPTIDFSFTFKDIFKFCPLFFVLFYRLFLIMGTLNCLYRILIYRFWRKETGAWKGVSKWKGKL